MTLSQFFALISVPNESFLVKFIDFSCELCDDHELISVKFLFRIHTHIHTCRYDLFYLDDDEQDPFEQLKQKKQKSAATAVTAVSATTGKKAPTAGQVINTNIGQAKSTNVNNNNSKTAEKENKISASNKSNQNNEKPGTGGKGGNNAQRSKGIKETGNVKSLDNRGPRDGKSELFHLF